MNVLLCRRCCLKPHRPHGEGPAFTGITVVRLQKPTARGRDTSSIHGFKDAMAACLTIVPAHFETLASDISEDRFDDVWQ